MSDAERFNYMSVCHICDGRINRINSLVISKLEFEDEITSGIKCDGRIGENWSLGDKITIGVNCDDRN